MNEKPSAPEVPAPGVLHESAAINGPMVTLCGLSLFAIVGLALLVSGELHRWLSPITSESATALQPIAHSTDSATLNAQQQKTRSQYEAEQRERLSTYGWVNQSKGTVHIPIDRAMAILVQKNRRDK
jgi:uncharacterized iron-regulated membrane protein